MARIYDDVTQLVGGTPLVRLNRLTEGLDATVAVKLEFYNPANSVKDRIGVAIIDAAEASGALKPGGTIVEGTTGNTGIALAMVGAARGYKVILTMPETMSNERRVLLRAFGAELVLTPGSEGMRGAVAKAEEIVANTENSIWAQQFANEANPEIHRKTTAEEIWADTDGEVDIFVAGIGTGGTITGVGQVLKERKPERADRRRRAGGVRHPQRRRPGPAQDPGHRRQLRARDPRHHRLRRGHRRHARDSVRVARALGAKEGMLGGISSGATVWGALRGGQAPGERRQDDRRHHPDFGERYLSTVLYRRHPRLTVPSPHASPFPRTKGLCALLRQT